MDKLQAMAVFVEIAEKGSLTAAAKSLGKSLPAVVRMLAALEDKLQARLFNRTTRRISLTEDGRTYLVSCRKILTDVEDSELALSQSQIDPHGSITLTAPIQLGEMHVAPSIARFLEKYSRIKINLIFLDRIVNLLDEGIDLAVRIAHLEDSSLIAKPVGHIRQVACASPALLKKTAVALQHPKQLSELACIHCSSITTNPVWRFNDGGKRLDVAVNAFLSCNQVKPTLDACIAGVGCGLFFNYQVKPWVDRGELKIILPEFEPRPLPLSIVYPHTRLIAMRVRMLVDWLARDLSHSLAE